MNTSKSEARVRRTDTPAGFLGQSYPTVMRTNFNKNG